MNRLTKIVLVLAAGVGCLGSAFAQSTAAPSSFQASATSLNSTSPVSSLSNSTYSFADVQGLGGSKLTSMGFSGNKTGTDFSANFSKLSPIAEGANGRGAMVSSFASEGAMRDFMRTFSSGEYWRQLPSYSGQFASPRFAPVAAVPEPTGWLTLLSGLAIVGLIVRRRSLGS